MRTKDDVSHLNLPHENKKINKKNRGNEEEKLKATEKNRYTQKKRSGSESVDSVLKEEKSLLGSI